MSIVEAVEYLKNCLNDEYNFKNATRKKDKEAIETLLTAYEKEKEKNKELERKIKIKEADIDIFMKKLNKAWVYNIRKIIYPTPENPIPLEVQQSDMYKKLLKEVEE